MMSLFSCSFQKTDEEKFWNWFCKNSQMIYDFESNREIVFDRIQEQLHKINQNLAFEISSVKDGKRDFVISADGIIEAFPFVEKLYAARPELEKWNFVKFRPRRKVANSIRIENKELESDDVKFMFIRDDCDGKVGIVLFLNGCNENEMEIYEQIGFLFLDEALGEYDTETYIGTIMLQGFDGDCFEKSIGIELLAEEFDKIKDSL